jgi:hypothetical protein
LLLSTQAILITGMGYVKFFINNHTFRRLDSSFGQRFFGVGVSCPSNTFIGVCLRFFSGVLCLLSSRALSRDLFLPEDDEDDDPNNEVLSICFRGVGVLGVSNLS